MRIQNKPTDNATVDGNAFCLLVSNCDRTEALLCCVFKTRQDGSVANKKGRNMKKTYLKNTPPMHACLPRSPLEDGRKLVQVQQNRSKWQCKPVCKLYVRPTYNSTGRKCKNFLIVRRLVNEYGMSLEEAMQKASEL